MWQESIQNLVDEIDRCIRNGWDAELTLKALAGNLGYSEYYISRKFREISGMPLREYLRQRRLAFALKALRDTDRGILDIALDHGFSSHEAFTRAFRKSFGITPSAYRAKPVPVALRTILRPFDCYLAQQGGTETCRRPGCTRNRQWYDNENADKRRYQRLPGVDRRCCDYHQLAGKPQLRPGAF